MHPEDLPRQYPIREPALTIHRISLHFLLMGPSFLHCLKDHLRSGAVFFGSVVLLTLIMEAGMAQDGPLGPQFKTFPQSSYDAHPQVYCVDRDPIGGMWFGTNHWVLHYDGEEWKKVPTRRGMAVLDIDIDKAGRIWVGGTSEFGYLRVVPPSDTSQGNSTSQPPGSFEYVSLIEQIPDSLPAPDIVWNIHCMGNRVIFNSQDHLYVLKDERFRVLRPKERFFLSYEVNGELWVQDRKKGLFRSSEERPDHSGRDNPLSLKKLPDTDSIADKKIMDVLHEVPGLLQEGKKDFLIFTYQNGIFRYELSRNGKEGKTEPLSEKWGPLFKKVRLYQATVLQPGSNPWGASLALSTNRKGMMLIDTAGRPVHIFDQEKGITDNKIWRSAHGAPGSGILWSTTNKGITKWIPGDPRTFSRDGEAFKGGGNDILRHKDRIFQATNQGVHYRKKSNTPFQEEWEAVEGADGNRQDLLKMKGNNREKCLLTSGPEIRRIFPLSEKRSGEKGWGSETISQEHSVTLTPLLYGPKRNWVASGGRDGILFLSREKDGSWVERLHITGTPGEILTMLSSPERKGKSNSLWVGLHAGGAFRLKFKERSFSKSLDSDSTLEISYKDLEKGKGKGIDLRPFTGKGDERRGLPKGETYFFSLEDRVVAGTSKGLFRYVGRSKDSLDWVPDTTLGCLFGNCPEKETPQNVFRLQESEDGSVWIQSRNQPYHILSRRNPGQNIDSIPFKGMGLGAIRSFLPDSTGITWMAGDNGLARYNERVEKDFERDYPCLLRKVSVPIEDTSREKKDSVLFAGSYRKPASEAFRMRWERTSKQPESFVPGLPFKMNGISFHYAAPYFEGQRLMVYSYRLEGFDDEWSQWKRETRKEYTNLPEGNYRFKVKAKNVYGIESEVAEYRFRILAPWYRTWVAYGGYTVAGIGFIWLLIWLNGRRLVAQKQRLERTVEERTREIREQQKETEKQKQEVEKKNEALEEANETITQQKEKVEEQKEKVEEAHREITASIEYAQKIQNALLQSEEYASEHMPEHFVLFKPQATVSGDFYWVKEQNGHLYFAAIDCTGHGVPGAFMSMLGISQLNEIMANKELPSPGEVLTELRKRVVAELQSSDQEGGAKDGMDAALLRIPLADEGTKEVAFSGAQNPLYVVRKGIAIEEDLSGPKDLTGQDRSDRLKPFKKSSDGIEIKGDPMPVGYDEYTSGDFSTVFLEVRKGDMLYMFSDGYADQFGGPKGKKFRYGPFKKLLAELHEKPVEEQKQELDRTFEEWKAESQQEQIDDVVVMGVRV